MKASEIITQLQKVLPQITNLFTSSISVTSITPSATTATVTTVADHGRAVGNVVSISGAFAPVEITSITRVSTIATAITATPHDLTNGFFETVTISGANESEFNGTFTFLKQVNRKTFTFTVPDSGAITGTGSILLEEPGNPFGYNGTVTVSSVPSPTTFTYTLSQPLTEPATGTMLVHVGKRITGAATIDRALAMYTKNNSNELWAFVILDDVTVSKDRSTRNDAVSSAGPSGARRQQLVQGTSVYIFSQSTNNISGRTIRDLMVDVRRLLLKSLAGVQFNSDLNCQNGLGMMFVGDGIEVYDSALYVHRFDFQLLTDITNSDTVDPAFNVAFRDINVTMGTSLGTENLIADIDLDDEPL